MELNRNEESFSTNSDVDSDASSDASDFSFVSDTKHDLSFELLPLSDNEVEDVEAVNLPQVLEKKNELQVLEKKNELQVLEKENEQVLNEKNGQPFLEEKLPEDQTEKNLPEGQKEDGSLSGLEESDDLSYSEREEESYSEREEESYSEREEESYAEREEESYAEREEESYTEREEEICTEPEEGFPEVEIEDERLAEHLRHAFRPLENEPIDEKYLKFEKLLKALDVIRFYKKFHLLDSSNENLTLEEVHEDFVSCEIKHVASKLGEETPLQENVKEAQHWSSTTQSGSSYLAVSPSRRTNKRILELRNCLVGLIHYTARITDERNEKSMTLTSMKEEMEIMLEEHLYDKERRQFKNASLKMKVKDLQDDLKYRDVMLREMDISEKMMEEDAVAHQKEISFLTLRLKEEREEHKLEVEELNNKIAKLESENKVMREEMVQTKMAENVEKTLTSLGDNKENAEKVTDNKENVSKVTDKEVSSSKVTENQVSAAKVTNKEVSAAKVTDKEVSSSKVTENQVSAAKVTDKEVSSSKVTENQVSAAKVTDKEVSAAKVTDKEVSAAKVTDKEVSAAKATDKVVSAAKVTDKEVSASKVTDKVVSAAKVTDKVDSAAKVTDKIISASKVTDEQITKIVADLYQDSLKTKEDKPATATSDKSAAELETKVVFTIAFD